MQTGCWRQELSSPSAVNQGCRQLFTLSPPGGTSEKSKVPQSQAGTSPVLLTLSLHPSSTPISNTLLSSARVPWLFPLLGCPFIQPRPALLEAGGPGEAETLFLLHGISNWEQTEYRCWGGAGGRGGKRDPTISPRTRGHTAQTRNTPAGHADDPPQSTSTLSVPGSF